MSYRKYLRDCAKVYVMGEYQCVTKIGFGEGYAYSVVTRSGFGKGNAYRLVNHGESESRYTPELRFDRNIS